MKPRSVVNILFLGGAKRVAMGRLFMAAAKKRGLECNIFSSEISRNVPISCIGTVVEGRRWNDPGIYGFLECLCRRHDIDIVIPFVDGGVAVAARLHERMPSVFVPASSAELCESMFDKVAAADIFEKLSIDAPRTYRGGRVETPLIAKPRHGSASQGLIKIDNIDDLPSADTIGDYLIQQRFDRREEISVDCYVSIAGKNPEPMAIVPRTRLEVAGGEVVRSITIDDAEVVAFVERALSAIGLRGAVTVQLIRDDDTGRLYIMEINPRLGGGAVCSVHAGADIPGMILDEAMGVTCHRAPYRPGTEIARYLQEVVFFN